MKHVTLIIILIPIVVNAHILHTQDHRVPAEQLEAERLRERRLRANTNANHRNERDGNAQKEARRRLLLTKRMKSRGLGHGAGNCGGTCFSHSCSKRRKCAAGGTRTRECPSARFLQSTFLRPNALHWHSSGPDPHSC